MSDGTKKVEKDHYLFREGDPPDALYVIKAGKLAVVKTKASSEIVLAELGPGQMVGEMAFFDGKPRSAGVRAVKESEVIVLPYKSLHAQFAQFPEWSKAIIRTVNESLRNANQKIKQLEKSDQEGELFPPHTITKLVSILNLVGTKYGKQSEEDKGLVLPGGVLRNYTIQVFQEPTHKMQKLMNSLMEQGLLKVEDIGEGRQKIVLYNPELLYHFVEWLNDWLFKKEKDRVTVKEESLKILQGVIHFCKKSTPDEKGLVKLKLTELQNESMRELGYLIKVEETLPLVELNLMGDHVIEESGVYSLIKIAELEKVVPFWSIIYTLKKIAR
ncbi:MAG: cyclic nucleotide-binding domain-containing protein [Proteobacteria bacterium]|jgi:CRP-like cAMP-binding protein|nr:cyclic nucleotide-binding domain-containing protein [Pseudomonadota bacterium]